MQKNLPPKRGARPRIQWRLWLPPLLLAACGAGGNDGSDGSEPLAVTGNCVANASFRAELYGELRASLDWRAADLECAGMRRPFNEGARLRFAGPAGLNQDARLAVIVALPALEPGRLGRELPATLTLMAEDDGRFYSNRGAETCWADVTRHEPVASDRYAIAGIAYCVAPLGRLDGGGSVTVADLAFAGVVDWSEPQ